MATNLLPNDLKPPVDPNESDEVFTSRHGQDVARGLEDLENHANSDSGGSDSVNKQEGEPNNPSKGGYYNNFTGGEKKQLKGINRLHFLRKKGPMGAIITLVIGGGMGFSALFSPSLLIVHMKEVMVDKFNTQLASMDIRTTKIISAKIDGATGGICGQKITIKCKYSTMSDKQVQKFKAAGIDIEPSNPGKRVKPMSFKYNGKDISAADFNKELRGNQGFRGAVRNAYNPKFAGFADSKWEKFRARIGLTKKPNITGATDEERTKNLNDTTKNGESKTAARAKKGKACPDCADLTQSEADAINAETDKLTSEAGRGGVRAGGAALDEVSDAIDAGSGGLSKLANIFKVTGVVDTACQAYGAVRTVGYAAKTIRAVQLARYAMAFLNTADMIKNGTAKPEDVAYMGGILTQIAYDAKSVSRGSATDSFGYKFAAFGDSGNMPSRSAQFLAGGGLTGKLIKFTSIIDNSIPGNPKETCRTLANPWVQAGSFLGGVALMFVPVVGQTASLGKLAVTGALQVTLNVGLMVLPNLLKDIVAGNTTNGIVGADSGDATASGSGGLMGGLANIGGSGAMTKPDAVAYNSVQSDTLARYASDEIATLSPFDTSSRHTFMGSIVASLIPSATTTQGVVGNSVSTIGSILSSAVSGLIPKTSAITTEQYEASLEKCQDSDYTDMGVGGIATDPFCNVIYGIPPQYLNRDPLAVIDKLVEENELDAETGTPQGNYKDFIANCINREDPLGSIGEHHPDSDGTECVVTDGNANYYLHFVDQRINTGMDGYDTPEETAASVTTPSGPVDPSVPAGTTTELAALILANPKITDRTGQVQQIASGARTNVDISILQTIIQLGANNTFTISSMKRDAALGVGAGSKSLHLSGRAFDLSGGAGINGVTFGYSGHDATIQTFINQVAATLPAGCDIGVPNQLYVDATKPLLKPGCAVFVDKGTAPHIHIDIKGGA